MEESEEGGEKGDVEVKGEGRVCFGFSQQRWELKVRQECRSREFGKKRNGSIFLQKKLWDWEGKKRKVWPSASPEKRVIEGTSWMTNWGGYEMRLDSIHTPESTLPYSMYQMGSLSGAFPLIIPFQCYAPTPFWRNLMGRKKKREGSEGSSWNTGQYLAGANQKSRKAESEKYHINR